MMALILILYLELYRAVLTFLGVLFFSTADPGLTWSLRNGQLMLWVGDVPTGLLKGARESSRKKEVYQWQFSTDSVGVVSS